MYAEPYKIKEVKKMRSHTAYERWNILKRIGFNTFHVVSDNVSFDMIARGMSAWSHHQKAGFMIGDEAYAGSVNCAALETVALETLGLQKLVPSHNGIGAEKLLATTMIEEGRTVLHNRGITPALVIDCKGEPVDVTSEKARRFPLPSEFGSDVDLNRLDQKISELGNKGIAYIHLECCAYEWNGQPMSIGNMEEVSKRARKEGIPLVLDISLAMESAYWNRKTGKCSGDLIDIVKKMVNLADVVLMDASLDARSDVGGFIASNRDDLFEKFRNQVVVFEGLHTYGGMTGRAMEVFARGLDEMRRDEYVEWHQEQIHTLAEMLREAKVPFFEGAKGIALDVGNFLPHLKDEDNPKFVLAACLYIHGGIRPRLDGLWDTHSVGGLAGVLGLDLPRCAYTYNHLREVADVISSAYAQRDEIAGLKLINQPEFVDEAVFEPTNWRLFVAFQRLERSVKRLYEPYKIAIFEPLKITDRQYRKKATEEAGYNTFLLESRDVYIDLLTDSGTSAMSCYQWEGMTDSMDTPYSSRHYQNLINTFGEVLGYNHIIPTHQGRAAEHIMSQTMIRPGQIVPGNMYFTTTKLHQEMAGGVFVDVIVDEAHDPLSEYPWKGNIDVKKVKGLIDEHGAEKIAYISFEMSVNMAGGQPYSMDNLKELSRLCQKYSIPIMFDATRCVENAHMIKLKDPAYSDWTVREILQEMMSYGDGCTISCKKDFLVNMGGLLACNSDSLAKKFRRLLRNWEGDVTNGGMDPKDIEALHRGFLDSLDDDYIKMRIEQTQQLGAKLVQESIPIVMPPGTHAIFLDAKRFLPHIDQDEYPAQALAAAIYMETGVRTMERGNVSKGRDPHTGKNYRPALELVRCTIPRRVYTGSHMDFVVDGIKRLYDKREKITGLEFVYEPKVLRFFQGRFKPKSPWDL